MSFSNNIETVPFNDSEIMVEVRSNGVYLTMVDKKEEKHSYFSLEIWDEPKRDNIVIVDNTQSHFEPDNEGFTLVFYINLYSKMFHLWCSKKNLLCYLIKRITIENGIENIINLEGNGFLLERKNGFGVHFSNDFSSQNEVHIEKDMSLVKVKMQIIFFHGNWYGLIDSTTLYICSMMIVNQNHWQIAPKLLIMTHKIIDGDMKMHRTPNSLYFIETQEWSQNELISIILKEKPDRMSEKSNFFLYLMKDSVYNPIQISEWNDYLMIANDSKLILFQDPPEDKDGFIVPDYMTNPRLNYHQETFFNRSIEGLNDDRILWVLPTKNSIDDLIILTGSQDRRLSRAFATKRKLYAGNPKLQCYSSDFSKLISSNISIEVYYANRTIVRYSFKFNKPSNFNLKLVLLIIIIFLLFVLLLMVVFVKFLEISKLEEEVRRNSKLLEEYESTYYCESLNSSYGSLSLSVKGSITKILSGDKSTSNLDD